MVLKVLYGFQRINGITKENDFAFIFDADSKGIVVDVNRTNIDKFDYSLLESLKTGHITSGKYAGEEIDFQSKKVLVLSNHFPDMTKLSHDRLDINYDYS